VLQRVGTRAYEAAGTAGQTDGSPGGNGSGAEQPSEEEGETIEGEYKEV
jgi:hypothetical protein